MSFYRALGAMSQTEIKSEMTSLEARLAAVFAEAGPSADPSRIKSLAGDSASKAQQVKEMNDRLFELKGAARFGRIAPESDDERKAFEGNGKSLGERMTKNAEFRKHGSEFTVPFSYAVEAKSDFVTSTGWAPESTRDNSRLALFPTRAVGSILDLLPVIPWTQAAYPYMQETTYTATNVVEKAEAAVFGEATLALTEVSEPIRKIPVFLPVSDELLEDVGQARQYIDNRLTLMIKQRLELQLLVGDGTAPNISGYADRANIQTEAKGANPVFDAVYRAISKVATVGFAAADAIVMHPNDYQDVRLTRTADGEYIMGNPASRGSSLLFDLPVIVNPAQTEGTALVGAFREHSALIARSGIEVRVSDSHGEYFTKGMQAIRAQMRVGLAVYRPEAFCTVTGI